LSFINFRRFSSTPLGPQAGRDYYSVLSVARTASNEEIRAAFFELAKKHHPDAQGEETSTSDRF
jgi:DnaJ-class molecular chaperone